MTVAKEGPRENWDWVLRWGTLRAGGERVIDRVLERGVSRGHVSCVPFRGENTI